MGTAGLLGLDSAGNPSPFRPAALAALHLGFPSQKNDAQENHREGKGPANCESLPALPPPNQPHPPRRYFFARISATIIFVKASTNAFPRVFRFSRVM